MREIMTELRLIKEDEEVVIYLNGVPADIILTMVLAIDRLASLTKTPHDKIIKAIEETLPEVNMQLQSKDEQTADRLAEYENTGLEPKEVRLIANVLREVGETYNCHFNFVVKAVERYASTEGEVKNEH